MEKFNTYSPTAVLVGFGMEKQLYDLWEHHVGNNEEIRVMKVSIHSIDPVNAFVWPLLAASHRGGLVSSWCFGGQKIGGKKHGAKCRV